MKADVLLGLQWGDEGKGKAVDVLAPDYTWIARFQGDPMQVIPCGWTVRKLYSTPFPPESFGKTAKTSLATGSFCTRPPS